jgi:hypothetical protein
MHRRLMVRREDVGQPTVRASRPEWCPVPPLVLILGVNSLRVNQKTAADKREKPNYSEFPNSWASGFVQLPPPLTADPQPAAMLPQSTDSG